MPETLDYAPTTWWGRSRRRVIPLVILVALALLAVCVPVARHYEAKWRLSRARLAMLDQRREEIRYRFEERVRSARRWAEANRHLEARVALLDAEVARDVDPVLFTSNELAAFDKELAETRKVVQESPPVPDPFNDPPNPPATRPAGAWRTLKRLSEMGNAAIERRDYERALAVCEQILALDPSDDYARGVGPLLRIILEQRRATTRALPQRPSTTQRAQE